MPPKKAEASKPSKKNELKKKEKVIEDKTFGLKNKKGAKTQKFIAQVEKQVKTGGDPRLLKLEAERAAEKKKKEEEKKAEEERLLLIRPVQKVEAGADPKSVFCAFFKQGLCKKGDKCKFSHDPAVERKSAKRNIYLDEKDAKEDDNMDDWDEEKLQDVVSKKHGSEKSNQTDIICKYFLDALESNKYGWFWACPNGGTECKYKHALPPGFTLKKDKTREDKTESISIEELIEQKRAELSASACLTPVTIESFIQWKKRKLREKAEKARKDDEKKKDKYKAGVMLGLSGREMFAFNPTMVGDEDDEEGGEAFDLRNRENEDEDDNVKVHEIKFDEYGIMDDGLDDSTEKQLEEHKKAKLASAKAASEVRSPPKAEAAPTPAVENNVGAAAAAAIDEDLFDDEDLDELDENLENLQI